MSKVEFLKQKASNFRRYIVENSKAPETEAFLNQYQEDNVVGLIMTHLLPLQAVGQLELAVNQICEACQNEAPEFREKVGRYLQCFIECVC